ncbi:MAG: HepT-like ribonuclease domain-containing protein [Desulfobacteria bacterium]
MTERQYLDYIQDIVESVTDIESFVSNMDFDAFCSDKKTINAVIRSLEVVRAGRRIFRRRTSGRLREFLAREYHRLKPHDEAMALIWTEYMESPALDRYWSREHCCAGAAHRAEQ